MIIKDGQYEIAMVTLVEMAEGAEQGAAVRGILSEAQYEVRQGRAVTVEFAFCQGLLRAAAVGRGYRS